MNKVEAAISELRKHANKMDADELRDLAVELDEFGMECQDAADDKEIDAEIGMEGEDD